MILREAELRWALEVQQLAHAHGWTSYRQDRTNERAGLPGLVLVRERVLLVFLRTRLRVDRRPPVDELAATSGAETVLWAPSDRAAIRQLLAAASTAIHQNPHYGAPQNGQPGGPR